MISQVKLSKNPYLTQTGHGFFPSVLYNKKSGAFFTFCCMPNYNMTLENTDCLFELIFKSFLQYIAWL